MQKNIKNIKQAKKQGFADSDTWSLDITAANWLLSRLKNSPVIINKHDLEVNEIMWFLEEIINERAIWPGMDNLHYTRIQEASLLFGRNILRLSVNKEDSTEIARDFSVWFLPRLKRVIEIKTSCEAHTDDYIFGLNEIKWMFEQIIKSTNINSSRFKRSQEIFGEQFLGLWW